MSHASGGEILRRFLGPTSFRPQDTIDEAWSQLSADLSERPMLTLTGYGRALVDYADKQVTEITCHGIGARFLCPSAIRLSHYWRARQQSDSSGYRWKPYGLSDER